MIEVAVGGLVWRRHASARYDARARTAAPLALDAVATASRACASRVALVHLGEPFIEFTYAKLWQECADGAAGILLNGAASDEPVASLCDEAPNSVIALLSISLAGCIFVPFDPTSPAVRLKTLHDDCNPKLCVCAASSHAELSTRLPTNAKLLALESAFPTANRLQLLAHALMPSAPAI